MKNTTNTLNKLTKLLAVAIISVSLNAFSDAKIGVPEMVPFLALKDKPLEIAGEIE
jgi:hypothetical protein